MKSSLPQIFKKDLKLLALPQKQSSQFSLYLRTNTFKPNQTANTQNTRYHKKSTNRINKSMDHALNDSKNLNLSINLKANDSLKRLLSQRNTARSGSLFIEEKSNDQIQQVDSFKTVRKRVLEQLTMLEKSMPIVSIMQGAIKTGMQEFRQKQIEALQFFENQMMKKMAILVSKFKALKKQTKAQVKANKDQLNFIEEEFTTYKQLVQGFEQKENQFKFQIIQGSNPVTTNKR